MQLELEENVGLAGLTTLGIGGAARYVARLEAEAELAELLAFCRARELPWMMLGSGSNLLVSDDGYAGMAIRMALRGIRALDGGRVEAAAGEDWDGFVAWCVARELAGVECLSGIPGTVGATPVQNVGAYGQEVADCLERVRAFDTKSETWVELGAGQCGFGYRTSRFNQEDQGRFVVTAVTFRLRPGGAPTVRYPELQKRAPGTLAETREAVREIRRGKAMLLTADDPECRSAGSFFKNPVMAAADLDEIERRAGGRPPSFAAGNGMVKVPAAWLIERAGFQRGFRLPGSRVGLSSRHVLAIVNYGGGTAAEVMALARQIQGQVRERFAVHLEPEPVRVGFADVAEL